MRAFTITLLFLFLFCHTSSYGQGFFRIDPTQVYSIEEDYRITDDEIDNGSYVTFMYSDVTNEKEQNPIKRFREDIRLTQNFDTTRKFKKLYGGKTLNLLFANKLATNFNTSNDLTLQKSYFNVNAAEKSFSLGYNFDNRRGDPLKRLYWVASIGAKVVASNEFATIATGGDLEENSIGFNLKYSRINSGRIGWRASNKEESQQNILEKERVNIFTDQKATVLKHREFLNHKYNKKVADFNKNELPLLREKNIEFFGDSIGTIKTKKAIEKKSSQLLYEMIAEEISFVESNKLYTTIFNSWWTLEAYIPVGDKEYDILPIDTNNKARGVLYYPFDINANYNFYKQKSDDFSYFAKFTGRVKGNSNIDVEGSSSKDFQSITTTNGQPTLTTPVSAVNISEFDRFITTSLKAEVALFYKGWIGFSPSIEKNFGTYDGVNWKLGIPFSLKDKEGKPTVNFELQWRETKTLSGNEHLFGFSTSFFFGNLVKKG
ncbi:MAG: hypothetical protein ACON5F_11925 [Jejuia sp.]